MKKRSLTLIIIGIILFIAALTNPNTDKHKEAVKAALTAYIQKNAPADKSELIMTFGSLMVDKAVGNLVSTKNYLLFSTTKITWEGKAHTIGFGAFGNVFLSDRVNAAIGDNIAGH